MRILQKLYLLFILLYIAFPINSNAQERLRHYTMEDGLPASGAYFIHEDFDGYIWVCTGNGLARFNGYEFELYKKGNGLTDNIIFKVFEDEGHNLYFTCYNGSISYFDYTSKKFSDFWASDQIKKKLDNNGFISFIGFDGDDIYLHPIGRTQRRYSYRFKISMLKNELNIEQITGKGILDYDNVVHIIKGFHNKDYLDDLLAIKNSERMVPFFKRHDKNYTDKRGISIEEEEIFYLQSNGVHIQTKSDSSFQTFPGATDAIRDQEGNLWVTTENNGVFKLSPSVFTLYKSDSFLETGDILNALYEKGDFIFLGTNYGEVYEYNLRKNTVISIGTINANLPSQSHKYVHSFSSINNRIYPALNYEIESKGDGHILKETGYYPYDYADELLNGNIVAKSGDRIFYFKDYKGLNKSNRLSVKGSSKVSELEKSIYGYGICKLLKINSDVRHYYSRNNGEGYFISSSSPYVINCDYSIKNLARKYKLNGINTQSLMPLKDDILLIGTDKGILIAKGEERRWINSDNGLPSNDIFSVGMSSERSLWCVTPSGISRINFSDTTLVQGKVEIDNFSEENGLNKNSYRSFVAYNGLIRVVTDKGLITFPEDISLPQAPLPKIHLLKWTQSDKQRPFDHQSFSYNENNMSIDYLGIAMQKPIGRPFYRYKLIKENKKTEWIYTNNRNVEFSQLSPGEYTFKITARNINDQWAEPKYCTFTIRSHWTGLWWIRSLFFGMILFAVHFYYKQDRRKRKNIYEKELADVQLREKLNSTELALLRGQMNPHFIYNALNSAHKFLLKDDKFGANAFISELAKMFQSSLEFSRADSVSLKEEIDFLENYMLIETQRFSDRFSFVINWDENLDIDDIQIPPLLVQPLCENAIKHAYDEEKIDIEIEIKEYSSQSVLLIITDTGTGYLNAVDNKKSKKSFGIQIVQKRLNIFAKKGYDASCTFSYLDKEIRKGTKIDLIIPVLNE